METKQIMKKSIFIERVHEKVIATGNGDDVFLAWVDSKINKAFPRKMLDEKTIDVINELNKVLSDDDVEAHTPDYLEPIFTEALNDYLITFQNYTKKLVAIKLPGERKSDAGTWISYRYRCPVHTCNRMFWKSEAAGNMGCENCGTNLHLKGLTDKKNL